VDFAWLVLGRSFKILGSVMKNALRSRILLMKVLMVCYVNTLSIVIAVLASH